MRGIGKRDVSLERLADSATAEPFDLLVVGGGITGAGIALDAAARGMRVGLVERKDFASGTSSKSSKLVHGGLRYLEQREFGLMREAALERDLLRQLAPQLVEPIPFVLAVSDRWARAKFALGLWAYDALASFKNLAVHRYLDVEETEASVPSLPKGKIKGGYLFYDCRNDDVRLVMEVLLQAVRHGAAVANYAEAVDLSGDEEICSALIRDVPSGDDFEVRAQRIVVAAGVWGDRVEALAHTGADARLRPSKGIHLSFRRDRIPMGEAAAFIPDVDRKRFLFVIPWLDAVMVGTTDTVYEGDLDAPSVLPEDRKYILDSVNSLFALDLTDDDVAGAWAGLRPLIASEAGSTADLSRRHEIYSIAPGIWGITGGKLTTYRRMAKDAVDRVADGLGAPERSRTHHISLGTRDLNALILAVERRAASLGLPEDSARNLVRCYGDRALQVLDIAHQQDLIDPMVPGTQPIAAEAHYCAHAEMVVHVSDLLARRTRLSLTDPGAGIGSGAIGVPVLAETLGWNERRTQDEIAQYVREIEHERSAPLKADRSIASA
jgi:glycerol-3-phosphate dehydrogenase